VFCTPSASLQLRSQYFGLSQRSPATTVGGRQRSLFLKKLNQQLWLLARVVLHPTDRGAGVAAAFVRRSCETCPVPWIETLSAMGHLNPFFEKAGFRRVGVIRKDGRAWDARQYARLYGRRRSRITQETVRKSRYAQPVYYVFDNQHRRE
jgi:ABC-type ATPase with predicted acetyltransferase domain